MHLCIKHIYAYVWLRLLRLYLFDDVHQFSHSITFLLVIQCSRGYISESVIQQSTTVHFLNCTWSFCSSLCTWSFCSPLCTWSFCSRLCTWSFCSRLCTWSFCSPLCTWSLCSPLCTWSFCSPLCTWSFCSHLFIIYS